MSEGARIRRTALLWGSVAAVLLAGALAAWLADPQAAADAAFGRVGSTTVLVCGLVAAVLGVLAARSAGPASALRRWGVALPVAVVAGAVAVLAFAKIFGPADATDVGLGFLLAGAAFGLDVVAVQVSRSQRV